jgi:hypothetical protein
MVVVRPDSVTAAAVAVKLLSLLFLFYFLLVGVCGFDLVLWRFVVSVMRFYG